MNITKAQKSLLDAIRNHHAEECDFFSYSELLGCEFGYYVPRKDTVAALVKAGLISAIFIHTQVSRCKVYNFGRDESWVVETDLDIKFKLSTGDSTLESWSDLAPLSAVEHVKYIGSKKYYVSKVI